MVCKQTFSLIILFNFHFLMLRDFSLNVSFHSYFLFFFILFSFNNNNNYKYFGFRVQGAYLKTQLISMNAEEQINADELCGWNVLVEYGNCSEWKYKFASFSMLSFLNTTKKLYYSKRMWCVLVLVMCTKTLFVIVCVSSLFAKSFYFISFYASWYLSMYMYNFICIIQWTQIHIHTHTYLES